MATSPGNMVKDEMMLQIRDLSKVYPGTVALHKVNITVKKGEVHGIIGKNGAGKSTLVGIIAGIVTPTEGDITMAGETFKSLSRINAKKKNIAIVPQEPQVIQDFTVAENLFLPDYGTGFVHWNHLYARAAQVLKKAKLSIDVRMKAGDLSISEQQLLLVVKACYVENARLIILDEASASLAENDEKLLYEMIEERKRAGNTILFISHRTEELLKVCDRVTVLRNGKSVTTADCCRLDEEKLSALIVGEDSSLRKTDRSFNRPSCTGTETLLAVRDLTLYGAFKKINFQVRKDEIVGLAGLRGSGRTEILKAIAGIDPADEGTVTVNNREQRFSSPWQAYGEGIAYLPEDREKEGLIRMLSVRENLTLNSLEQISRGFVLSQRRETTLVQKLIAALGIKTASPEQEVSQLSGGNKQKVVVGKVWAAGTRVLLLDEPTRGIDIAAKESILRTIDGELRQGRSIIITSPGLEDLMLICDRILALYKGEIIDEFSRAEFDEEALYVAIQGNSRRKTPAVSCTG